MPLIRLIRNIQRAILRRLSNSLDWCKADPHASFLCRVGIQVGIKNPHQ